MQNSKNVTIQQKITLALLNAVSAWSFAETSAVKSLVSLWLQPLHPAKYLLSKDSLKEPQEF